MTSSLGVTTSRNSQSTFPLSSFSHICTHISLYFSFLSSFSSPSPFNSPTLHRDVGVTSKFTDAFSNQMANISWALSAFPVVTLSRDDVLSLPLASLLHRAGLTDSVSNARRSIQSGGVQMNRVRVNDIKWKVSDTDLLGGRFILLQIGRKEKKLVDIGQK